MTTNSNMGGTIPATDAKSGPVGVDNPGQQTCPNCRQVVIPHPTNGIVKENNGGNSGKAAATPTSAGYSCPACGHSFSWTKSTGRAAGPAVVDNTNQPTAADM